MNHFYFQIAKRYAALSLTVWTIFIVLDFLLGKLSNDGTVLMTSLVGFLIAVTLTSLTGNSWRWVQFWRRSSQSIRQFWFFVFAIHLFSLGFNGALFYLATKLFSGSELISANLTPSASDVIWVAVLAFSVSLLMTVDVRTMAANSSLKPTRQLLNVLGLYVLILIFLPLFAYSRLLAYAFAELSILIVFLLQNSLVLTSIRRPVRICSMGVGAGFVLLLSMFSVLIEYKGPTHTSAFLGKIGPQRKWLFADIESLVRPSDWISWFSSAQQLNSAQMVQALLKLESLCPPGPTDAPTLIECHEKMPSQQNLTVTSGDINFLEYLESPSEYVKLVGLLKARELAEFPPELKEKIEKLSRSPGRLSPVAEMTSAQHAKGRSSKLRIVVRAEK